MTPSDSESGLSNPPSELPSRISSPAPSTVSSSDDSSLGPRSPTPTPPPTPPSSYLITPPASQQTSQSGSPVPDGMDDKEGPPPAKRRRISKEPAERCTRYLDLRDGEVDPEQQAELDCMIRVLHKRQKIVVIAGAGISVSAGIPDFRSSNGLFRSLKEEHKLKGSGKHLFDASVYKDDTSTSSFHDMVSSMSRLTKDAKPTAFHHMLATIAKEDRLLRLYSQNVDGIDTSIEPLGTRVPLQKDEDGKWPRTVQLHGGLDKMVCSKCHEISDFDADLFSGSTAPLCSSCEEINDIRTNHEGKRSHGIGRLRPRMVLYHEHNPDDVAIGAVTRDDLRRRPDAIIVAGTTLKVPGVRRIVREMCGVVRDRRGGVAIWINNDLPPAAKDLEDCFDIVVQGTCDEVAHRAAMRKWDAPAEQDSYSEISDDDARKAEARTAEVLLTTHKLTHANLEALPSDRHFNNSFAPPPLGVPPRKAQPQGPSDWSPLPGRSSLVLPSIEDSAFEGDTIAVNTTGLLTPTKSQKSSPPKQLPSLNDKLKDAANNKKPVGRPSKSATTVKPKKKRNVKHIKPSSKAKSAAASKTQPEVKASGLANAFKQTKTTTVEFKNASKKSMPSPSKSPSKLRQVSNASSIEPMHPVRPQDPRNNLSPWKPRPVFPGLQSEDSGDQGEKKRIFDVAGLVE